MVRRHHFRSVSKLWILFAFLMVAGILGTGMRGLTRTMEADQFESMRSGKQHAERVKAQLRSLGGMGRVVANLYWLKSYHAWEKRNPGAAFHYANRACQLHPDQWFFRENTALMIAHDFPRWLEASLPLYAETHPEKVDSLRKIHGQWALDWLGQAALSFPEEHRIDLLAAHIALQVLDDVPLARDHYRKAWEKKGPLFAARIHGELLRMEGREVDALLWYQILLDTLSEEFEYEERWTIEQRLKSLRLKLDLPSPSKD